MQGEIDESTILVKDFNTPLSEMNISGQQIRKDLVELHSIECYINQRDITDICRPLRPTAGHPFSSSSHGIFCRVGYILGHKTHVGKFRRLELSQ